MTYNLFTDFWDSIAGAATDSVAWFQSLGYAVGGALGGMLTVLFQPITDLALGLTYVFSLLSQVFLSLSVIVAFYLQIMTSFMTVATGTITEHDISFPVNVSGFLAAIPYWSTIGTVITWGVAVMMFMWWLKIFMFLL